MERALFLYMLAPWFISLCCCRDKLWGVCVSILALLPRVLRLMLQSLRVNKAGPEELPVVGQMLRLLLQHAPLKTHMLTNAILVQQIIKNITVRSMQWELVQFMGKAWEVLLGGQVLVHWLILRINNGWKSCRHQSLLPEFWCRLYWRTVIVWQVFLNLSKIILPSCRNGNSSNFIWFGWPLNEIIHVKFLV